MKKRITLFLLAAALPMAASANSDELMSAQAAFRQALAAQNSTDAGLIYLQQRLEDAQRRKLRPKPTFRPTRKNWPKRNSRKPPTTPP